MSAPTHRSLALLLISAAAAVTCLAAAAPGRALAQNAVVPRFDFQKAPEAVAAPAPGPPPVEWKVQAKGGFLLTSGNSRSHTGTFTLDSSRQSGGNKLSLNGNFAYGRSSLLVPTLDAATMTTVVGFSRASQTTTNEWRLRARYDRFITPNNAAYLLAQIGATPLAGKSLVGGGQLGYSRQLYKSDRHTAVVEGGYDFSYESYVQPPAPAVAIGAVAIHSARVFAGEQFALTKETGFTAGLEALFNLNQEKALDASDSTGATKTVGAFKDIRLVGKLGMSTTLRKSLSVAFGFTLRYDQNPAPQPLPASAGGRPYAPGFQAFADSVDTLTEATLIYTFL